MIQVLKMKVKRFKFTDSGKIRVEFEQKNNMFTMKTEEEPEPELKVAINDLRKDFCEICELAPSSFDKIFVKGIRVVYLGDNSKAYILTGVKYLDWLKEKIEIKTPLIREFNDIEQFSLPQKTRLKLDYILKLVEDFVNGTRSQLNLFDEIKPQVIKTDVKQKKAEKELCLA